MKAKYLPAVLALLLGYSLVLAGAVLASDQLTIKKFTVSIPPKFYVPYNGVNKADFPQGFIPGFGSGITLKSINKDGSIEFYGITDRGPNGDGPDYLMGSTTLSSKFFPAPDFQPKIAIIKLQGDKAEVTGTIGLTTQDNKAVSGLPLMPGLVGSTNEAALDENMTNLGYDKNGLDTEAIALDAKGTFWVCDEYGPFLAQFDKNGKLLKKYAPGSGLPEVLKWRVPNRGFEGMSVAPSNKVFAAVQSPLDIEGQTGKTAGFTRIVELDPATGQTKMYAYPVDVTAYKSPKDAKIGDLYAISDTKLLLIEQGTDKNKAMRQLVYLVDLSKANDISNSKPDNKELEFSPNSASLPGVTFATKKQLLDLRAIGWEPEKAEGLCLLPDKKTLVVTNDNDFGITMQVTDDQNANMTPGKYIYSPADSTFTYKGKPASPSMKVIPNSPEEQQQQLWLIELPEKIQ